MKNKSPQSGFKVRVAIENKWRSTTSRPAAKPLNIFKVTQTREAYANWDRMLQWLLSAIRKPHQISAPVPQLHFGAQLLNRDIYSANPNSGIKFKKIAKGIFKCLTAPSGVYFGIERGSCKFIAFPMALKSHLRTIQMKYALLCSDAVQRITKLNL